jgi:hypothetical protein
MYQAFNKAIMDTGTQIVETFINEEEEENEDRIAEETKFIPELIGYRCKVQEILNGVLKGNSNVDHSYSFKKEEKDAFEKICELKGNKVAELLANYFSGLLHK